MSRKTKIHGPHNLCLNHYINLIVRVGFEEHKGQVMSHTYCSVLLWDDAIGG